MKTKMHFLFLQIDAMRGTQREGSGDYIAKVRALHHLLSFFRP